jgi:uncharacterized protein YbaP (TraB family)
MRSLITALLLLPFVLQAQDEPRALLWNVRSPDGSRVGVLLGTIHSQDHRAYAHFDRAVAAMVACDAAYGELDLDAAEGRKSALLKEMMMPGGRTLKDLYPKGRYNKVMDHLRKHLGPLVLLVGNLKPILISAMVTEQRTPDDSITVLDDRLLQVARAFGIQTGGLETMAEQMAALNAVSLEEQADLLYETVRHDGFVKEMDHMLDAYAQQDVTVIKRMMKEAGVSDAFGRSLVTDRNQVMAQRMDSILQLRSAFFGVGAAHLPGADGVVAHLRTRGYTVEPVPADSTRPVALPAWTPVADEHLGLQVEFPYGPQVERTDAADGVRFVQRIADRGLVCRLEVLPGDTAVASAGTMYPADEAIAGPFERVEAAGMPAFQRSRTADGRTVVETVIITVDTEYWLKTEADASDPAQQRLAAAFVSRFTLMD